MSVLTANNINPNFHFGSATETSYKPVTEEGQKIVKNLTEAANKIKTSQTFGIIKPINKIYTTIEKSTGYVTISYISKESGICEYEINELLESSNEFGKSFIKGKKGDDVYYIKQPYSKIKDIWKTFKHVNAEKF